MNVELLQFQELNCCSPREGGRPNRNKTLPGPCSLSPPWGPPGCLRPRVLRGFLPLGCLRPRDLRGVLLPRCLRPRVLHCFLLPVCLRPRVLRCFQPPRCLTRFPAPGVSPTRVARGFLQPPWGPKSLCFRTFIRMSIQDVPRCLKTLPGSSKELPRSPSWVPKTAQEGNCGGPNGPSDRDNLQTQKY